MLKKIQTQLFKFRDIVAHQGPLESTDPNHKGSKYNVMVEWESGEVTYEPLTLISKDDPITCAVYAKKHDLLEEKAVTAVLHFLNQTPIDAYTKRQSTVETATYGSEFVAARTAVDQIIDIRTTLRYLGVPIRDKSYMFGDNRSVVTSSTIPNSTISKSHHLASYHRVREAIAAKFISFHWKDGKSNPADILSKHWEFATVWPMLKPILFWRGETATQLKLLKPTLNGHLHGASHGTNLYFR